MTYEQKETEKTPKKKERQTKADFSKINVETTSKQNITRIRDDFIRKAIENKTFQNKEEAIAVIAREKKIVESEFRLTINMSYASLDRIHTTGSHDSIWNHLTEVQGDASKLHGTATSQGKSLTEGYTKNRTTTEDTLRKLNPEFEGVDPKYTAVTGGSESDRIYGIGSYGNYVVRVDPKLEAKTVFHFGDSLNSAARTGDADFLPTEGLLTREDAVEAKAIINIAKKATGTHGERTKRKHLHYGRPNPLSYTASTYVEGIVFDEITDQRVETVTVNLTDQKEIPEFVECMGNPKIAGKLKAYVKPDIVAPNASRWLAHQMGENVEFLGEPQRSEVDHLTSNGLTVDSSYEEIGEALTEKARKLWRKTATKLFMQPNVRIGITSIKKKV